MATENATTTIQNDNTDPRYDAMNEGERGSGAARGGLP